MMDTLYIIGNGYDLHHNLRTSYANFRDDYASKKHRLWESLTTIYGDKLKEDLWWSDFEKRLSQIDYSNGMCSHRGIVPWIMQIENLLKNEIPSLFGDWINSLNSHVKTDESLELKNDAYFFTFNYTMVLEDAYHVNGENVWHIHHSMSEYMKYGENPIVGHDSSIAEQTSRFNEFRKRNPSFRADIGDMINQNILKGAKNVKDIIYLHEDKFSQYSDIKHFVVMGFSFNDIDMPYIKKIIEVNKNISDADWTLYWYSDGEDEYMINKLLGLGIDRSRINTPIHW